MMFGIYIVVLKQLKCGDIRSGRQSYTILQILLTSFIMLLVGQPRKRKLNFNRSPCYGNLASLAI